MTCARCGIDTPRLTLSQRRCPPCQREVERIVAADAKRRTPRWPFGKDLSGLAGIVL